MSRSSVFGGKLSRSSHGLDSGAVDDTWRRESLCRLDPDGWFPSSWADRALAAHRCRVHCPVFAQCKALTLADEREGRTPLGGVQAGILFNEQGQRAKWTSTTPGCDSCTPSADEVAKAERDIAYYARRQVMRARRPPAAKGAVQAHAEMIERLAREHVTDAAIAEQIGCSEAAVGKIRRAAGLVRRQGWHESAAVRSR